MAKRNSSATKQALPKRVFIDDMVTEPLPLGRWDQDTELELRAQWGRKARTRMAATQ